MPRDGLRLGIDLGTSNTVAVLHRAGGRDTTLLMFDGTPVLPSAVYWGPGGPLVGADAVHSARLRPELFEPYPKLRIDDGTVLLGEHEVPVTTLIAAVLRRVAGEAVRVGGQAPDAVTLAHPAAWGPRRREVLALAAAEAGLGPVDLVAEPIAAAWHFMLGRVEPLPVGAMIVVYDFGAGTFDASVVRRTNRGFEVLATGGLPDVGGLDIDAAIMAYLGAEYADRDRSAWSRLTAPASTTDRRANRQLWDDVRQAKEILSRASGTHVQLPLLDVDAPLGREQLETLAGPLVRRTVLAVRSLLRGAGIAEQNLAGVYLVGGSSRLPLAATLLHHELGIAPEVIEQPELAVAQGCLLAATQSGEAPDGATVGATDNAGDVDHLAAVAVADPPRSPPAGRGRRVLVVAATVVALLAAALVGVYGPWRDGSDPGATTDDPPGPVCDRIIAFLGPLGDPSLQHLAAQMRDGAAFAVARYNDANPGCQVKLVEYDSEDHREGATRAARRIVDDTRIVGVVGPLFTNEARNAGPILETAGLPFVSPSITTAALRELGWRHYFPLMADEGMQARAAIVYLRSTLPAINCFIVYDDSAYGTATSAAVRASPGVTVAGEQRITTAQTWFADTATAVVRSGAGAIFFGGFASAGGPLLRQLREAGFTGTFVGADGLLDDQFAAAAGPAAAPAVVTGPRLPATEATDNFVGRFEAKYGTKAEGYEGYAYDAANILLTGLAAGVDTRPRMRDHIAGHEHGGVMFSRYRFEASGAPAPADVRVARYAIVGGKLEYQGTAKIV